LVFKAKSCPYNKDKIVVHILGIVAFFTYLACMKEGTYGGKRIFVDLTDAYKDVPISTFMKIWYDARPKLKDHLNDVVVTKIPKKI